MTFVLIGLAVTAVVWLVLTYNALIGLKNQVKNAWKQIDVQLKRRHDLIPNLVNTVKGAMTHERETLDAVITARNQAIAAQGSGSVARMGAAEQQLTGALGRLLAVVEAYPDVKATANVAQLQEELTSTENKIAFARQGYNDMATLYNTRQQQFPTNLVRGLANAEEAELWELTEAGERIVPQVDLSLGRPAARPRA